MFLFPPSTTLKKKADVGPGRSIYDAYYKTTGKGGRQFLSKSSILPRMQWRRLVGRQLTNIIRSERRRGEYRDGLKDPAHLWTGSQSRCGSLCSDDFLRQAFSWMYALVSIAPLPLSMIVQVSLVSCLETGPCAACGSSSGGFLLVLLRIMLSSSLQPWLAGSGRDEGISWEAYVAPVTSSGRSLPGAVFLYGWQEGSEEGKPGRGLYLFMNLASFCLFATQFSSVLEQTTRTTNKSASRAAYLQHGSSSRVLAKGRGWTRPGPASQSLARRTACTVQASAVSNLFSQPKRRAFVLKHLFVTDVVSSPYSGCSLSELEFECREGRVERILDHSSRVVIPSQALL